MNATVRFIDSPIVFGHPPLIRCAVCGGYLDAKHDQRAAMRCPNECEVPK